MKSAMKTDKQMIQHLNVILKNELTAINQYFLHAKMLKHMGYGILAAKEHEESIDEMKHADGLAERILFLGGLPNFQDLGKLSIGQNAKEMLEADLAVEQKARQDLQSAIAYAEDTHDYGSVELLTAILVSEEQHHLWLEQQLGLIKTLGLPAYLQMQFQPGNVA